MLQKCKSLYLEIFKLFHRSFVRLFLWSFGSFSFWMVLGCSIDIFADVLKDFDEQPPAKAPVLVPNADENEEVEQPPSPKKSDDPDFKKKPPNTPPTKGTKDPKPLGPQGQDPKKTESSSDKLSTKGDKPNHDSTLPINFSSDGVEALKDKGIMQLIKNVLVTQGDLKLIADRAKVFFDPVTNEVIKIIAEGKVEIEKFDQNSQQKIQASGNVMTFFNQEQKVILEGNAKLVRGSDIMKGNKITYDMKSGTIKAEKIESVVHPEKNKAKK